VAIKVQRRNTFWFWLILFVFVIGAYGGLTYAAAGMDGPCSAGYGRIEWNMDAIPPRFVCVTGGGF
jgi:hypothetical protein